MTTTPRSSRRPSRAKKHVVILSLGAGIQSTTLALLLEQDALPGCPKPQAAIFADTFAELPHVYETLDWLEDKLSYPIIRTSFANLAKNTWKALAGMPVPERGHHDAGYIDIPVFSETGIGRRQCTGSYKVKVIKQAIREFAKSAPPHLTATQYLGISTNETRRAKPAQEQWITNRFPLIEHGWTRMDCITWLDQNHRGHKTKRSACYFCPYHTLAEWKEIRELYPALYQDAVAMDRQMAEHPRGPWRLRQGGLEQALAADESQLRLLDPYEPFCSPT